MSDAFWRLVNLSISAGWLILAVLAVRFALKKAPKWIVPLLWGVVALRLVLPFSIESSASLIPSAETIPPPSAQQYAPSPSISSGVTVIDETVNPILSETFSVPADASGGETGFDLRDAFATAAPWIWISGMTALLIHALMSAWKLRKKLATAILLRENIYESEFVASPFVFGAARPRIYLPMHMDAQTAEHVIAHERAHLARGDHWWKLLGYFVLALHWYNPLVWLAYILFCRDIELACDEKVVRTLDAERRADYSMALLACAAPRRSIAACPLAFGEVNVKTRVKSALHYKKPAFWVAAAAVLAVVVMAVCFLTNPKSERDSLAWAQGLNAADVASIELYVPERWEEQQYRKLNKEQMEHVVWLINSSHGTYIEKPETVYGGLPVWFLLTMDDGTVHAVGSVVGHYLIIDGDTFVTGADDQMEWESYVPFCNSASPIDMADRLSYALYGITTGVYTLSEAVFEDSVWETSYEETFANTKSAPELWLSSTLGTDVTGILYGTVTAARGYSYRFSEWEEINLTVSNFDWLFRGGSGEDWNGTSAAKLRRENAHAWRGTKTAEDYNATDTITEIARQDELAAMNQWLLLQQKDGSLYLVMGYRSGGLPYSGAHPYRWIVRLTVENAVQSEQSSISGNYSLAGLVYEDMGYAVRYSDLMDDADRLSLAVARGEAGDMYALLSNSLEQYYCASWEETALTEESFDACFRSAEDGWLGGAGPGTLRENNLRAWRGLVSGNDAAWMQPRTDRYRSEMENLTDWLLLEQRNGERYLVLGDWRDAYYRWVILLGSELTPEQIVADLWNSDILFNRSDHDDTDYHIWNAEQAQEQYARLCGFTWLEKEMPEDEDAQRAAILAESVTGECGQVIMMGPAEGSPWMMLFYENTSLMELRQIDGTRLGASRWYKGSEAQSAPAEIRPAAPESGVWETMLDWYGSAASENAPVLLALSDLNGDGTLEHVDCKKGSTASDYTLRVLTYRGETLWSEPLRIHDDLFDTAIFLCREDGRDMLLEYEVIRGRYRGEIAKYAYNYTLRTFDGGRETIQESGLTGEIYFKPAANQNGDWTESHQQFADHVNALMDQSTLLLSYRDGTLSTSGEAADWHCVSPLGEAAAPVDRRAELLANADTYLDFGDILWYTADGKFCRWAGRAAEELYELPDSDWADTPVAASLSVVDGRVGLGYHVGGATMGYFVLVLYDLSGQKTAEYSYKTSIAVSGGIAVSMSYLPSPSPNNLRISRDGGESWEPFGDASYFYGTATDNGNGGTSFQDAPMEIRGGWLYTTAVCNLYNDPNDQPRAAYSVRIDLTTGETELLGQSASGTR